MSGLTEVETVKVRSLLLKYQTLFATSNSDLGQTDAAQHRIRTKHDNPIRAKTNVYGRHNLEQAKKAVDSMLEKGVIEPSSSPYNSPVILIPKKDGSTRFCVDYRRLNAITHKDAYPLPDITAILDTLSGSKWFCTLDLASGYWQIPVHPQDREKTAFSVPGKGHYHFCVMPFGLTGAPATFERMMENILSSLLWNQCLSFLDDVMVCGSDVQMTLNCGKFSTVFKMQD